MTSPRDLPRYRRRTTRVVQVGDVGIGGGHPIRVQSMTTPATTDTKATAAQIARLVEAGCEIVRLTVPTSADADALPEIRRELASCGVRVPLVADIHFTPAAAMRAVEHVEKIRVNPGNFADKKKFAAREYTDAEYRAELGRLEAAFSPLVRRAKELGVAMRIGTNHGSLSDRILNRHGDTPEGMVESALEFVRICESHGYRDLVLSMKASSPRVALEAYRFLVRRMDESGMDYPLHLGVTEAGGGEDARVKSGIGIGALLDEGLGDTIRVSLTEDPVAEIPVARALVAPYNAALDRGRAEPLGNPVLVSGPYVAPRPRSRESLPVRVGAREIGGDRAVLVEVPLAAPLADREALGRELDAVAGASVEEEARAEIVEVRVHGPDDVLRLEGFLAAMEVAAPRVALSARVDLEVLRAFGEPATTALAGACHRVHLRIPGRIDAILASRVDRLLALSSGSRAAVLVEAGAASGLAEEALDLAVETAERGTCGGARLLLAVDPALDGSPLHVTRALMARLSAGGLAVPLVLVDRPAERGADPILGPASQLGGLLCEGIGDAVHVESATGSDSRRIAFGILQGARVRMTRTEFISCPSCGRTLFDLESTVARIRAETSHLKGLKIAVMGCVVNGPGEMADADFGYVGWGEERVALFVGKELVEKDIPAEDAPGRLVELIRSRGKWTDPPAAAGTD